MSTLDVVADVLREVAPRALKAREIAARAGARLPSASRTPETVVSRDLAIDVRDHGAASRFLRVGRGEFVLKEALPTAFYNDNDSYAAQWTRNLIAAGEIAAGVVDERSIRDLKPADVASYRQCHFFSGIGVWSRALRDAGWPAEISTWTGSAPCQPWSSAGQRKGHDDERDLWPEWFRLIKACRPAVIFGEQVASKDGIRWFDEGPDLQQMQDREAVLGVLRELGIQGGEALEVQGMRQTSDEGVQGTDEGGTLQVLQDVATEQPGCSTADVRAVPGEEEGFGIHDCAGRHQSEDQARHLRADGDSLQSQEWKDLGQSVDRQDRCLEGIHEGQCSRGAVLRERDGERLGVGQDRGDCRSNHETSEGQGRGAKVGAGLWEEFGEELEEATLESSLRSVRSDLEGIGYTVWAINAPACSVGAPHRRQRLYYVAYARERGRAIVSASWLHDRGQSGNDALGRGTVDGGDAGAVSDAAGARPCASQDAGADRGDAGQGAETIDRGSAGDLESQRGGDADDPRAVSDAERVVWDARRIGGSHGRSEVESDRHGEVDGTEHEGDGAVGLGDAGLARGGRDAGLARGGRDAGAVSRAQGAGERERLEVGDLADELVVTGADDGGPHADVVRGAAGAAGDGGFRPGDRIRIGGDPSWGGAVRGRWAEDVEWIYCRPEPGHQDGRWRPAEFGTQPLVDRLAPGLGRTRAKRLKGFGNAIVLPQATVFVEAVLDAFVDASQLRGDLTQEEVTPEAVVEAADGSREEEDAA